jgi:hypothetical protein
MDGGRVSTSTIEYMQQYGVHPQVAMLEVQGYINLVNAMISKSQIPNSSHLEDFLDEMSNKYFKNADIASQRLYGKEDITNTEIMSLIEKD